MSVQIYYYYYYYCRIGIILLYYVTCNVRAYMVIVIITIIRWCLRKIGRHTRSDRDAKNHSFVRHYCSCVYFFIMSRVHDIMISYGQVGMTIIIINNT